LNFRVKEASEKISVRTIDPPQKKTWDSRRNFVSRWHRTRDNRGWSNLPPVATYVCKNIIAITGLNGVFDAWSPCFMDHVEHVNPPLAGRAFDEEHELLLTGIIIMGARSNSCKRGKVYPLPFLSIFLLLFPSRLSPFCTLLSSPLCHPCETASLNPAVRLGGRCKLS